MKYYVKSNTFMTPSFQKRCDECKEIVMKAYDPATEDYYEEDGGIIMYEETVADSKGRSHDWQIDKQWLIYTDNFDENGNRVRQGAKVPGSIHYEIAVDYDTADEENYAFKTLDDAKKYMKYLQHDYWYSY